MLDVIVHLVNNHTTYRQPYGQTRPSAYHLHSNIEARLLMVSMLLHKHNQKRKENLLLYTATC